jgi:hypothetical protein
MVLVTIKTVEIVLKVIYKLSQVILNDILNTSAFVKELLWEQKLSSGLLELKILLVFLQMGFLIN